MITKLLFYKDENGPPGTPNNLSAGIYHENKIYFNDCIQSSPTNSMLAWNHVVITYNHGIKEMFLNSNLECTSQQDYFEDNFSAIYFAKNYAGAMDDIILYNRVLSIEEVDMLYDDPHTSTSNDNSFSQFKIFPNPTTNFVFIESNEIRCKINLVDRFGRILYSGAINQNRNLKISLENYPKGIYSIVFKNNEGMILHNESIIKF